MLPLFDMLANAQNGKGMEHAGAAVRPVAAADASRGRGAAAGFFSQGLKRNASDPYGVGAFMTAMASGQHAKYFEDAQNAFSPQGMAEGNGILGPSVRLEGAVARGGEPGGAGDRHRPADVLQQMLPVIASMIMGGLFKQSTNQLQASQQAAGFGGSGNPLRRDHRADDAAGRAAWACRGGQPQQQQAPPAAGQPATRSTIRSARC